MAWWFVWNSDLNLHFGSSTFFTDIKGWKGIKEGCVGRKQLPQASMLWTDSLSVSSV
jgi:hypothetical protein